MNTAPVQQTDSFRVVGQTPLPGLLGEARSVAILGDSYSSGEGAERYIPGTDNWTGNNCHRSEYHYGGALYGNTAYTIACSGATTQHLVAGQPLPSAKKRALDEVPQLQRLHMLAAKTPVDAVMLTLGGNDIGFADVVRACILDMDGCETEALQAGTKAIAPRFINTLLSAYLDIDHTINDASARAQRGGRYAPIVVLPYARPIPTTDVLRSQDDRPFETKIPGGCVVGLSLAELEKLNTMVDALNSSISRAVSAAQGLGMEVYYAQPVVNAFQPDHTVCHADNHVVDNVVTNALPSRQQQLAHPNIDGHADIASVLRSWSQSAVKLPQVYSRGGDYAHVNITGPSTADKLSALVAAPLKRFDLMEPPSLVDVQQPGFAPHGVVTMEVHSRPRSMGAFVADEHGTVRASFRLPVDLEPGRHTIVLSGLDASGNPKETRTAITVLPRYSGIVGLVFLAGVVLAAGAAISLRRARKRRTAAGPA